MADKTYKMTVTLSDGNTVDAGTFVAPQGPEGPAGQQGASGAINDWTEATPDTTLSDGTYLIRPYFQEIDLPFIGVVDIRNGGAAYTLCGNLVAVDLIQYYIVFKRGKIRAVSTTTGESKFVTDTLTVSSFDYIKLK